MVASPGALVLEVLTVSASTGFVVIELESDEVTDISSLVDFLMVEGIFDFGVVNVVIVVGSSVKLTISSGEAVVPVCAGNIILNKN